MDKSTVFFVLIIVVAITILGVAGEYFAYKYYSLVASRPSTPASTEATAGTPQISAPTAPVTNSSDKSITSFAFQNPTATGIIDQSTHTITVTVPPITDMTKLTPTIAVSAGATVLPASGTQEDFTNPVAYLVTAQNGSTQEYSVTVNQASILNSVGNSITAFKFTGLNPEVDGTINENNKTIYAVVPDGTDLTALTPVVEVSPGATVYPKSESVQDFTNPVVYTVTDSYGDIQEYTVTVVTESNSG